MTTLQGIIRTSGDPLSFGEVVLAGNTQLTGSVITLGAVDGEGNLTLSGNVNLTGGLLRTTGNLIVSDQITLLADTIISHAGTTTLSQPIAGAFNLTKAGTGTLRLNDRTAAGTVTAQEGTLELPNGLTGTLLMDGGTVRVGGTLDAGLRGEGDGGELLIGTGPATLNVAGDVLFAGNTTLHMELDGATAGTGYDQLNVIGAARKVDLANATLDLTLGFTPIVGSTMTLVNLVATDSERIGEFTGLPEDSIIRLGATGVFRINYSGGDGNDVVLTTLATSELDFGAAPDSYGTLLADNGARHLATGPTLGATRDAEPDAGPDAGNEDGVTFTTLTAGMIAVATVDIRNALVVRSSTPGLILMATASSMPVK